MRRVEVPRFYLSIYLSIYGPEAIYLSIYRSRFVDLLFWACTRLHNYMPLKFTFNTSSPPLTSD